MGAAPVAARQTVATLAGNPGATRVTQSLLDYGPTLPSDLVGYAPTAGRGIDEMSPYGMALKALRLQDRRIDEKRDARRATRAGFIHHDALPSWGKGKAMEFTYRHLVEDMEKDREQREWFASAQKALALLHGEKYDPDY